ncbi:MAG TPA: S41 family peptidase [Candidatus Omnitrophota bacterium]|nr:S41 family peptidase [Candidatus Omnitrophota bacterium]HQO59116.1 S41 family peptidase [Candidatus Omnitrophota bacterium]HQP12717.1 S41 family peptidase [Candidatus Omnitrophota bacterium]
MGKKFVSFFFSLTLVLVFCSLGVSQMDASKKIEDLYSQIEIFSYALTTIQSEYVDEKKPQELIYGALNGMLAALDPHSQFLTPEDYQELKTETQGKFGGLGIEISIKDGLLTIISPIEDTPAWRAGLKAGDIIVKIEDEITKNISLSDAVKRLRGEPETPVTITVLREKEFKFQDFTIVREVIQIQDIKDTQILEDKIGYIRLTEFREDTHKDFLKAIEDLRVQEANALILDLRNNPGGLLNVAIDITDAFLPTGEMIVSTKGRRPSQNIESKATYKEKQIDWPVVVLINEGSASGSEILAGALKDNKRAIIVGEQSFGKGSVQSVIPLPDGSGLRLTTSKYFTPSGVSIHGTGITPDVVVVRIYENPETTDTEQIIKKKEKEINKIFDDVEMNETAEPEKLQEDKKKQNAKQLLLDDNQIQAAISIIKGIRVYKNFGEVS